MASVWIGVYKDGEVTNADCKSCLSDGVRADLTASIPTTPVPSVPWLYIPDEMNLRITEFLTQHPMFAFMHAQHLEGAKHILCTWCLTEGGDYSGAPGEDNYTKKDWNTYFEEEEQITKVIKLGVASPIYKMTFEVDEVQKCYYVIGPRDTMTALFGWHAKISDALVNIDLTCKVDLSRNSFLHVHKAVDYAEMCRAPRYPVT